MSSSAKVIPLEVQNELNEGWRCVTGDIVDRQCWLMGETPGERLLYMIFHYHDALNNLPTQAEFLTMIHTAK